MHQSYCTISYHICILICFINSTSDIYIYIYIYIYYVCAGSAKACIISLNMIPISSSLFLSSLSSKIIAPLIHRTTSKYIINFYNIPLNNFVSMTAFILLSGSVFILDCLTGPSLPSLIV